MKQVAIITDFTGKFVGEFPVPDGISLPQNLTLHVGIVERLTEAELHPCAKGMLIACKMSAEFSRYVLANKISCIKDLRSFTGMILKDAKDNIDALCSIIKQNGLDKRFGEV